jgi:hypothetical protein
MDYMNAFSNEWENFNTLDGYVKLLADCIPYFEEAIGSPVLNVPIGFRYENPGPRVIQVLLSVRIASGLRAAAILIRNLHIVEVGVLLRTIDDFIGDIRFVEEAIEKGDNAVAYQKKFIEEYFVTDGSREFISKSQKVQACEGRFYNPENPHHFTEAMKAIDKNYDMFVHGDYEPVMDLHEDDGFCIEGIMNLIRIRSYRKEISHYVHRAMNIFAELAYKLDIQQLTHELIVNRKDFEKTQAYLDSPNY